MKLLFVHQNFPGQFRHLAPAMAARGHEVHALRQAPIDKISIPGVVLHGWTAKRGTSKEIHPLGTEFETKLIRGDAGLVAAIELNSTGFYPDLIVGHPGWGDTLFLKDLWPKAKYLAYLEFYYRSTGSDVNFDPEFHTESVAGLARLRVKNANNLLALESMDCGLSPTKWQRDQFPTKYRDQIKVVFDGIDTKSVKPDPAVEITLNPGGRVLKAGDEILTFVNRNLEPYRGYHRFMRALPEIQKKRPNVITLIVGGNGVSYGAAPTQGSWRDHFLNEVKDQLDMSRVFFLGNLPYPAFLKVLQISRCHVYFSYPFVLSWSLLEAMACECNIVASDTAPVREVITNEKTGILVDFFGHQALVKQVCAVLNKPESFKKMAKAARQAIVRGYDLHAVCLPKQIELLEQLGA